MDTTIQELIVDLKVISLIEPNGKLYLNHGSFALETNSFLIAHKTLFIHLLRRRAPSWGL